MGLPLRITQWNAKSVRHKLAELSHHSLSTDIFLIAETWLDLNDNIHIKGFDCVRKDRLVRRGGGVMILIWSNIKYKIIENTPDCQGMLEFWH